MQKNTTKQITYTALFTALAVIFNLVDIPLNNTYSLSLVFIPCFVAGVFLGPWLGATSGFLGDVIAHLLHPRGVYIPFISISSALYGMIPGLLFGIKRGNPYLKTVISYVLCFLLCTAGFNNVGLWLTYAFGKKTFIVYSIARLPFQSIVSGVNCALTMALAFALGKGKGSPFALKFGQYVRKNKREKNMKLSKEKKLDEVLAKIYEEADKQTLAIIEKRLGAKPETEGVIRGRYQYSFTAKLHLATEEGKSYYSRLKNAMLAYGFKSRMSWANESFYAGRKTYAKLGFSGKKLVVYLALTPADYLESKYYFKDVSEKAKYAGVPMAINVKSTRGLKWAEELVAILAQGLGKEKVERKEEDFRLPTLTVQKLLAKGLVKETVGFGGFSTETEGKQAEVALADWENVETAKENAPNKIGRAFLKRKDRKR